MQQRTTAHAFANFPQTAGAGPGCAKIDLAGVLDRQHMPADNRRASALTPPGNQPLDGHPRLREGRLLRLARKRLNRTSERRFPSAARRRHVLPACTIPSRSAAPFFQAAIPEPTQRHLHRTSPNAQRFP